MQGFIFCLQIWWVICFCSCHFEASHRGGTYSGFSWNEGSLQANTFSVHPSLRRLHWLRQLITWTLFPCKYLCVPRIPNASFTICLLPSPSLSLPSPLLLSSTFNKITHSLSQVFFFHLSCYSSPPCQSHTPKRAHTHMHCQLVFTHSCMQLPATRRYLKHEALWPVLFIRSIKIAPPWVSINLPSVCMSVYSKRHPAYDAPEAWKLSQFRRRTTCSSHVYISLTPCCGLSRILASSSYRQLQMCRMFRIIHRINMHTEAEIQAQARVGQ